ncbi:MAG: DUF502 domain-containing protein [Planctomycetota bacterium]|jgi:uncharacterized membrane protein
MTTNPPARTFSSDFKRFFIRGLVVLLPSVLTLWIVVKAYQFVDNTIAEPINRWVRVGLIQTSAAWQPLGAHFDPDSEAIENEYRARLAAGIRNPRRDRIRGELRAANIRMWWDNRWYLDFIGLIVAIVAVYVAGRLLGGFFGRQIYRKLEALITTVPVFKQVYPYVKQVVDFLFSDERPLKFNRVVVLQYPREGIWSVGFLTGDTMKSIARESGDSVTVFIPSSPTPFTGYTITVPRRDIVELPITVEEAIRFAITGGVLIPQHQLVDQTDPPPASSPAAETRSRMLPLSRRKARQTSSPPHDKESRRDAD